MTERSRPDQPSEAPPSQATAKRGSVFTVLLVIFIDLLGFGMILPMLPYLALTCPVPEWADAAFDLMRLPEIGDTRGYAVLVALLSFAFSFAQFVVAPIWGRLSDRVGRKPVLSVSLCGYLASWVLFYFAFATYQSMTLLIIARLLAGLFAANISTAQAYIADIYPPEKRSKGMGLVGAAFGLGFTLGPALGGGLIQLERWLMGADAVAADTIAGLRAPVIGAAALTVLALVLCVAKLPESLPPELRGKVKHEGHRLARLMTALKRPVIGGLLAAFFTATMGFAVLETLYSLFNADVLKLDADMNALTFSIIGLVIVLVQGGLISRLTTRFGPWNLLLAGLMIEGTALLFFGFTSSIGQVIVVAIFLAFGNSLANPSILGAISSATAANEQGERMGLTQASAALGRLLGPIAGGLVWGYFGPPAAFAMGGAIILIAVPVALRSRQHARKLAAA